VSTVGYSFALQESRYFLQVSIGRLDVVALRDDLDVQQIIDALEAQQVALGRLIEEASG
jgi:hypothetical protein